MTRFYYNTEHKEVIDRISFINEKGTFVFRQYCEQFEYFSQNEVILDKDVLILEYK